MATKSTPPKVTVDNYFNAARALYWYCSYEHDGQASSLYRILCELGYSPGSGEKGAADGDEAERFFRGLELGKLNPSTLLKDIKKAGKEATV